MNKNKKIFLIFAAIFFVIIAAVSYDIAKRTTFPGSKSQLKERIKKEYIDDSENKTSDTVRVKNERQD
jgi:hypothetical protein